MGSVGRRGRGGADGNPVSDKIENIQLLLISLFTGIPLNFGSLCVQLIDRKP